LTVYVFADLKKLVPILYTIYRFGLSAPSLGVIKLDRRYNHGYTQLMKTAISIPNNIFDAAEKTAKRLGVSRSELYSNAVKDYIDSHIAEHITDTLNEIYTAERSSLDPNIRQMMVSSIEKEDW